VVGSRRRGILFRTFASEGIQLPGPLCPNSV
jgi:hypothetical protein